jgi:hypothetical protein
MKRLAIFFGVLSIAAVPASAQRTIDPDRIDRSQVGSRFSVQMEAMEGDEMRIYMKRIGRCLARNDRELAARMLENSDPVRIDYRAIGMNISEIAAEMNMSRCIGSSMPSSARYMRMNYSGAVLRPLLAEEMYLHANDDPLVIPVGAPVELENRFFVGGMADPIATTRARFADCIVYNDPVQSHEFLRSNPNSGKERDAAQALAQTFGECLGSEADVTFSLAEMRLYLADGLWSRSHYGQASYADAGGAE